MRAMEPQRGKQRPVWPAGQAAPARQMGFARRARAQGQQETQGGAAFAAVQGRLRRIKERGKRLADPEPIALPPDFRAHGLQAADGGGNILVFHRAQDPGFFARAAQGCGDEQPVDVGFGGRGAHGAMQPARFNGDVHSASPVPLRKYRGSSAMGMVCKRHFPMASGSTRVICPPRRFLSLNAASQRACAG